VYTPLAILLPIGLGFFYKQHKSFTVAAILFVMLGTYITLSWVQWWYGGTFGMRAFIQWYGLLAIGICSLLHYLNLNTFKIVSMVKATVYIFIIGTIGLNLFQSFQYKNGIMHWDDMTKEKYWRVFGKSNLTWEEKVSIYGFGW
jgi:hypothetical protein